MQSGPNTKQGKEKAPDYREREELKTGKKMPHQLNQKTGKRASVDMIWATWFDKFKVKNY